MAVPITPRRSPTQCLIALNVARVYLASVTDQHNISLLRLLAIIADIVHALLPFFLFILCLKLFGFYHELLAFVPKRVNLNTAEGTSIGALKPCL
jgi:hypothetical protein